MPGLRMQPGLFFFPLYHTNKAVKDFNVLTALTVYNGAFSDLDVVNQFLNDFPVKLLHIQVAADDACPLSDIFNLLPGFSFLCQKNLQTLCLWMRSCSLFESGQQRCRC